jgi:FixJ family two-component response regulator
LASLDRITDYVVSDDDADARTSIEDLLEEAGFRATSFDKVEVSCASALDGPGCIILDVSFSGINGLDFSNS